MKFSRRDEFDHTSEGGAWSAESTSNGEKWEPAKPHPSNRTDKEKAEKPPIRRIFGL